MIAGRQAGDFLKFTYDLLIYWTFTDNFTADSF
jgi:hypothetical protein